MDEASAEADDANDADEATPSIGSTAPVDRSKGNAAVVAAALAAAKPLPHPDALICAVCLDEIDDDHIRSRTDKATGCVHVFHWDCIKQWFRVKVSCPVCNAPLYDYGIYEVDPIGGTETFHQIRPEGVYGSLHTAAAEGNAVEIQRLLASGASVNRTTAGDVAPLHVAAHNGHAEAIARLLAGGASVNQPAQGGATPLYIAAQNRHAEAVARLLAGGAAVNQAIDGGGAPLHVASQSGHTEAVAWLLAGSAQVDQAMDGGTTPLFLAAQSGHTDVIVRLLAQGASVNRASEDGSTPLHYAALSGHTESVARLLVGGADVNKATLGGGTALHIASQNGHTEAVAWLLAGKAEVNKEMVGGATSLYLASRGGHAEVIAWLLAKQAEVNRITQSGACPLYIASHGGHAEAVCRLLAGGAQPNEQVGRTTPLRAAVVSRHTEVIGRLLSGGATAKPEDVWLSLLLGNLRGARRLAAANKYSWPLLRNSCLLGCVLLIFLTGSWLFMLSLFVRGGVVVQLRRPFDEGGLIVSETASTFITANVIASAFSPAVAMNSMDSVLQSSPQLFEGAEEESVAQTLTRKPVESLGTASLEEMKQAKDGLSAKREMGSNRDSVLQLFRGKKSKEMGEVSANHLASAEKVQEQAEPVHERFEEKAKQDSPVFEK